MNCNNTETCDNCYNGLYINWNDTICSDTCLDTEEVLPGDEAVNGSTIG
jgi:hypothetical protein